MVRNSARWFGGGPHELNLSVPQVETVYPRRKEVPKGYLRSIVGDAERQVEYKRVEEVVASGSIEHDLRRAMKVCIHRVLLGFHLTPASGA